MFNDLRYALRMMRRSPGFTLLALAALGLGIGANCAIFNVVDAVLLARLPYSDPRHLYEIGVVKETNHMTGASITDFEELRKSNQSFRELSVDRFWSYTLTDPHGDAERLYGRALTADALGLLGVKPRLGRIFSPDDFRAGAPHVAIISEKIWKKRYSSDPSVVGQQMQLDQESYTIIGVMPTAFQFPLAVYDVWTPWIFSTAEVAGHRDHGIIIYARLRDGVTLPQAQSELDAFSQSMAAQFPDTDKEWHPLIGPTKLGSADRYRAQLLTLLGAVGFVLFIACLNVANLLLARAAARQREMAVRIALGAGRWRMIRQLLTESLLLALLGAGVGIALARWGAHALMQSFPLSGDRPRLEYTGFDGTVLGFTIAIAAVAGILFGLAPALQLSRSDVNTGLKDANRGSRRSAFRGVLIVAETALSLMLLIGAGLLIRSFARLTDVDPGFRRENVLTVQVPMPSFLSSITNFQSRKEIESKQAAEYADLIDHVKTLPGVVATGVGTVLPFGPVEVGTSVGFEGDPNPQEDHSAALSAVSPDYFRTLGIPLLEGRVFQDSDAGGAPDVAIVNDILAKKYWPHESAIGKHVNMSGLAQGPWYEVVGIVGAIHRRKLEDAPRPELYRSFRQYLGPAFGTIIAVRTERDAASLGPSIRAQIRTLYPNQPIGPMRLMKELVDDSVSSPRFYMWLLAAFAGLAMILAAAGIYGVMSYSVAQRTRELGIRMALGASGAGVVRLVLREGLMLAIAGIVLGVCGASALARLIRSQLYETAPTDSLTFVAVSILLLGVAGVAAWVPASRAAGVDPAIALREE